MFADCLYILCLGKTFTIIGEADESRGLLPRAVEDIFCRVEKLSSLSESQIKITVKASILEIYHEKLRDLLNFTEKPPNLAIREQSDGTIWVENCIELEIKDASDYQRYLSQALRRRVTGGHKLNERSSRSHLCCLLSIHQFNTETNDILSSKLSIIDLAGSEMAKKTGASGQRFDEAKFINKSLSALSKVISALASQSQSNNNDILLNTRSSFSTTINSTKQQQQQGAGHIPFRDSKLTRLLQSSLSGNSKTIILLTISDSAEHINETISTLKFGERARLVMTKPQINRLKQQQQQMNAAAEEAGKWTELVTTLKAQIATLTSTIDELKATSTVNSVTKELLKQEVLCEVCQSDIRRIDNDDNIQDNNKKNNNIEKSTSRNHGSLNPLYALNPVSLPLDGKEVELNELQFDATNHSLHVTQSDNDRDENDNDNDNVSKVKIDVYESDDEVIDRCGICGLSSEETYTLREDTGEYLGVLFSCDGNCGSHFHSRCVGLIGEGGQYSLPDGEWYCTACEADLQQTHRSQQNTFIMNGSALSVHRQHQQVQSAVVRSSVDEFVVLEEDHLLHSHGSSLQLQQRYDAMRKERNRVLQHWQQEKKRIQSQENRRQQRVIALEEDQLATKEEMLTLQDQLRQQQIENEALRQCIKEMTTVSATRHHHDQQEPHGHATSASVTISPNSRVVKLLSSTSMSTLTQSKELQEFMGSLSSLHPSTAIVHELDENELIPKTAAESPTSTILSVDDHHNHSTGNKIKLIRKQSTSDKQSPLSQAQIQNLGKTIQDALQNNRSTPRKDSLPVPVLLSSLGAGGEEMTDTKDHDTVTPPLDAAKEPPSRFLNPLKNRLTELLALVREEADSYAEIRAKAQRREELRGSANSITCISGK